MITTIQPERANPITTDTDQIEKIRATLSGQQIASKLEEVRLQYGQLFSKEELSALVRQTIPPMPFRERVCIWTSISDYKSLIPQDALLKYGKAKESMLFGQFSVLEPKYELRPVEVDPWIVAYIPGSDRYAVVASWQ